MAPDFGDDEKSQTRSRHSHGRSRGRLYEYMDSRVDQEQAPDLFPPLDALEPFRSGNQEDALKLRIYKIEDPKVRILEDAGEYLQHRGAPWRQDGDGKTVVGIVGRRSWEEGAEMYISAWQGLMNDTQQSGPLSGKPYWANYKLPLKELAHALKSEGLGMLVAQEISPPPSANERPEFKAYATVFKKGATGFLTEIYPRHAVGSPPFFSSRSGRKQAVSAVLEDVRKWLVRTFPQTKTRLEIATSVFKQPPEFVLSPLPSDRPRPVRQMQNGGGSEWSSGARGSRGVPTNPASEAGRRVQQTTESDRPSNGEMGGAQRWGEGGHSNGGNISRSDSRDVRGREDFQRTRRGDVHDSEWGQRDPRGPGRELGVQRWDRGADIAREWERDGMRGREDDTERDWEREREREGRYARGGGGDSREDLQRGERQVGGHYRVSPQFESVLPRGDGQWGWRDENERGRGREWGSWGTERSLSGGKESDRDRDVRPGSEAGNVSGRLEGMQRERERDRGSSPSGRRNERESDLMRRSSDSTSFHGRRDFEERSGVSGRGRGGGGVGRLRQPSGADDRGEDSSSSSERGHRGGRGRGGRGRGGPPQRVLDEWRGKEARGIQEEERWRERKEEEEGEIVAQSLPSSPPAPFGKIGSSGGRQSASLSPSPSPPLGDPSSVRTPPQPHRLQASQSDIPRPSRPKDTQTGEGKGSLGLSGPSGGSVGGRMQQQQQPEQGQNPSPRPKSGSVSKASDETTVFTGGKMKKRLEGESDVDKKAKEKTDKQKGGGVQKIPPPPPGFHSARGQVAVSQVRDRKQTKGAPPSPSDATSTGLPKPLWDQDQRTAEHMAERLGLIFRSPEGSENHPPVVPLGVFGPSWALSSSGDSSGEDSEGKTETAYFSALTVSEKDLKSTPSLYGKLRRLQELALQSGVRLGIGQSKKEDVHWSHVLLRQRTSSERPEQVDGKSPKNWQAALSGVLLEATRRLRKLCPAGGSSLLGDSESLSLVGTERSAGVGLSSAGGGVGQSLSVVEGGGGENKISDVLPPSSPLYCLKFQCGEWRKCMRMLHGWKPSRGAFLDYHVLGLLNVCVVRQPLAFPVGRGRKEENSLKSTKARYACAWRVEGRYGIQSSVCEETAELLESLQIGWLVFGVALRTAEGEGPDSPVDSLRMMLIEKALRHRPIEERENGHAEPASSVRAEGDGQNGGGGSLTSAAVGGEEGRGESTVEAMALDENGEQRQRNAEMNTMGGEGERTFSRRKDKLRKEAENPDVPTMCLDHWQACAWVSAEGTREGAKFLEGPGGREGVEKSWDRAIRSLVAVMKEGKLKELCVEQGPSGSRQIAGAPPKLSPSSGHIRQERARGCPASASAQCLSEQQQQQKNDAEAVDAADASPPPPRGGAVAGDGDGSGQREDRKPRPSSRERGPERGQERGAGG
uniref:Uncharacterized protein n=1 Tax=Chromera velia CCMP2878 TaxID=1169474 RepID=A0A0G4H9C6_9ALVE|eukprot:Cvel_25399.t1-p1 / transcript=Cvel_25399.t1 / gene=Cvel_25399 / organism=Chromera_velia_CCMP2878 / gene_product=hypothetical protein / transcript_product=hypothetical protein / location=Cvel_scaffold2872:17006-23177(+) / protein_length=1423 / sequence_SO=supercontig / SO=protein_coding / is_pseudo=false